jgi:chromosome segregation ATPase
MLEQALMCTSFEHVLQLEETLAETKATAARHESSLEASTTKLKSLEKQLAEARDSMAAGSSAKEKEVAETRKELQDARAKCSQVSRRCRNILLTMWLLGVRGVHELWVKHVYFCEFESKVDGASTILRTCVLCVLQLEEALAEAKANAVRQESSLEASATKLKSLEKQLTEARDSLTAGSSAKEKEVAETKKELQDARAKCSQVSRRRN